MIVIKNWIATIPEEDRHLAYVGEHQTVTRQFLLTGKDWSRYQTWGFHLDMAFDLSSVTTRDQRRTEVVSTNSTEDVSEVQIRTQATTRKEQFTEEDVTVDCWSETDIASLEKEVNTEGILLTWRVHRQHVLLPGMLRATIRAVSAAGEVKKSAMMLFDVEPAVAATAAAELPISQFEDMEMRINALLEEAIQNSLITDGYAEDAAMSKEQAQQAAQQAETARNELMVDLNGMETKVNTLSNKVANMHAVSYVAQELTEPQKQRARANLGLVVDGELSHESTNPVQNKVVYGVLAQLAQNVLTRLDQLEQNPITVDSALSLISENPVQNRAITSYISKIETDMGTVDDALESILAIQQSLMGGESV